MYFSIGNGRVRYVIEQLLKILHITQESSVPF